MALARTGGRGEIVSEDNLYLGGEIHFLPWEKANLKRRNKAISKPRLVSVPAPRKQRMPIGDVIGWKILQGIFTFLLRGTNEVRCWRFALQRRRTTAA